MTNERAVKILKGAIKKPNTKDGYLVQALDMAIKALERQEKTLSYIDRLLNQGTGKKKSLEYLKKYILEGDKE